jgi:predicted lipoprotein
MLTLKFVAEQAPASTEAPVPITPRPSSLAALAAAAAAIAWACLADPGPDEHDPLRLAILHSEVEHVIAPTLDEFDAAAATLRDATAAWSAATQAGEDATAAREAAREAWRQAMSVWQRAEVLQIGPAGSSAYVIGGEDLRDDVYAWPTVGPCRVDEELVARSYAEASFFANSLVNVRGLAAVEYLLFTESDANACAPGDPINVDGSWTALGADEVARRRAAYATAATAAVATIATDLSARWVPGSGQFARWITAPGEDGSPYEHATDALDDVLGASFYVDGTLKDAKLAATSTTTESPHAVRSKEHALANLEGLRQLVLGGRTAVEGTGFDDFLIELGEDALAAELMGAIDRAVAAVGAVDGSFEDALAADPAALANAQVAVQQITDLLKGPVATALRLTSPGEAAGDAD